MTSKLIEAVQRCDIDSMKDEIESGADLSEIDSDMTPLHWAILAGYFDGVKLLLERGADPNVCPRLSGSPLWSAEDDFGLAAIAGLLKSFGARK